MEHSEQTRPASVPIQLHVGCIDMGELVAGPESSTTDVNHVRPFGVCVVVDAFRHVLHHFPSIFGT